MELSFLALMGYHSFCIDQFDLVAEKCGTHYFPTSHGLNSIVKRKNALFQANMDQKAVGDDKRAPKETCIACDRPGELVVWLASSQDG